MIEEEDAVEVVQLMLDGAGLEPGRLLAVAVPVAVGGLEHDPLRAAHLAVDLRDGEAAFLGRGAALALDDDGIDHLEAILVGVDHGHPAGHADLVSGQPHAARGVHRLEQVVHQPANLVVRGADLVAPLAQRRRAHQVQGQQAHAAGVPGAEGAPAPPIRTMRERSTMKLAVPLSTVTRVSFAPSDSTSRMSRTFPMMPPLVMTSSPFFRLLSSSACFFRAWLDGRRMRK